MQGIIITYAPARSLSESLAVHFQSSNHFIECMNSIAQSERGKPVSTMQAALKRFLKVASTLSASVITYDEYSALPDCFVPSVEMCALSLGWNHH